MGCLPSRRRRTLPKVSNPVTPITTVDSDASKIAPAVAATSLSSSTTATAEKDVVVSATPASERVHRVTMFKLPAREDQERLLAEYEKLAASQSKDGKPYILSMMVGPTEADPRSQGWTLVCKTEFASMADMKFYDDECAAHNVLRVFAKTLPIEDNMTVFFTPKIAGGVAP